MTDFLQNLGTIGCLGAEREAFATQLSATHTTRKSHVFAGNSNPFRNVPRLTSKQNNNGKTEKYLPYIVKKPEKN